MRILVVLVVVSLTACTQNVVTQENRAPSPLREISSEASATPRPIASQTISPTPAVSPTIAATAAPSAATPTVAPTLPPRDVALLAQLHTWCARPGDPPDPPLAVLLALADGRSAQELGDLVVARSGCPARALASGKGSDEILTLSWYADAGAILWVDQGWWRAARLPLGFGYGVISDRCAQGARELVLGLDSGGSGGGIGVLVVQLIGNRLAVVLAARPGGSHMGAFLLDDDHILLTGRQLPDRSWGWTQNCCMPGGHEWLYERRGGGFALVAERQMIGPVFALNAFVGALAAGRADLAADVGTFGAIASGRLLITQRESWVGDSSLLGQEERNESLRWEILSRPLQLERHDVGAIVGHYGPSGVIDRRYVVNLGFVDGGWRVTSFGLARIGGPS